MSHRILVVEDDDDLRESLCGVLDAEGYRTIAASNGQEALDRLAEGVPSLVLLDLNMPVMDGEAFLAEVRSRDDLASLPVIVVSALSERAGHLHEHAQGFLKKPVRATVLLETISVFLSPTK
jgi:CheY-like chemotaxis protein